MTLVMDWLNVVVYRKVRRIDILIVVLGLMCVAYYGFTAGLLGALQGGALFVLMVMVGLWLL